MTHAKPNPEIFLKAAACVQIDPAHARVLEDSLNGVRAAIHGGCITGFVYDDLSDLPSITEGLPADTSCIEVPYPTLWDYSRALADKSFTSLADVANYLYA